MNIMAEDFYLVSCLQNINPGSAGTDVVKLQNWKWNLLVWSCTISFSSLSPVRTNMADLLLEIVIEQFKRLFYENLTVGKLQLQVKGRV